MTYPILVGYLVTLVGGGVASWAFISIVSRVISLPKKKPNDGSPRVPPWLTGVIERSFFFLILMLGVSGVVEAMMGWLALKLAANWQRYDINQMPSAHTRAVLALAAGLVSLAFVFIGGAIAKHPLAFGI
ncbi:MAG TPA: hypothetical protein VN630_10570 [Rhodanobacteraceae bacterium]|nr:hypothetical protein [Rhodanobacteraceae bacterium]